MIHELKVLPQYYGALILSIKTFEIRKNDRSYQVGDKLILKEWDGDHYTGRAVVRYISYILNDFSNGLKEGYCILGLWQRDVRDLEVEFERH